MILYHWFRWLPPFKETNKTKFPLEVHFIFRPLTDLIQKKTSDFTLVAIAFVFCLRNANANDKPIGHHPLRHWWQREIHYPVPVLLPLSVQRASSVLRKIRKVSSKILVSSHISQSNFLPSNSASESDAFDSWAIFFRGMTRKWTGACAVGLFRINLSFVSEIWNSIYHWCHGTLRTAIWHYRMWM